MPPLGEDGLRTWLDTFPADTQVALAILALQMTLGRTIPPRGLPGATSSEINGEVCLYDELVFPSIATATLYLAGNDDARKSLIPAATKLGETCDNFIPDPEMLLDGRFSVVTGAGCLMFAISKTTPSGVDWAISPYMCLYHLLLAPATSPADPTGPLQNNTLYPEWWRAVGDCLPSGATRPGENGAAPS